MRWRMSIHDMNRVKKCEQYDSDVMPEGQAYGITLSTEMNGWKELTFSIAQTINGERNFRWAFIRSGYQVCVERDGLKDWFLLSAPKLSHKGLLVTATVTCGHVCSLLNKKNLYLTFDDENGVGTARYLLEQALKNTGWRLGFCETFYESDGVTEKVRSLKSESKRGTYLLVSDICKLFSAYPVYHGDDRAVDIISLNRHENLLELNFGKNLTGIDRKEDADNIVTRLYVEGEYADSGYVGIDSANPTGQPFLLNFDYYRELGIFTAEHEAALSRYMTDMQAAKAGSVGSATLLNALDGKLNALWGQIDYVLYAVEGGSVTRTVLGGDATSEQAAIADTDDVTVLLSDGTHHVQTGGAFSSGVQYAIKFILKASAQIGGKEVAIEAKEQTIASLEKQLAKETDAQKRQAILEQIAALRAEIALLYSGSGDDKGLSALMREAVQLAIDRADAAGEFNTALTRQEEIEEAFALAMGDMLRDGYWSNTSYAPGQEQLLYHEASGIMDKLAKPSVSYSLTVQNLSGVSGYEQEVFEPNMALRIWDEALSLNDMAYVTKLIEHPETPEKDAVTISNDLTSIGGTSLDGIIARITGIAEIINQKQALYDRSKAISQDGSIPAKRLEGMIDVLKTRLTSSVSNWYTDENGNLILEALNGSGAMQLCGEGFMIANAKTDDGKWDWRTFGTGEGFTADMLVTGFLSADRIQAHTITANKLAADVGQSLDLSSNTSITMTVQQTVTSEIEEQIGYRVELTTDAGDVLSQYVPATTLRARVYRGSADVTGQIAASRFRWTRSSADGTADRLWNDAHAGVKQITLTTADVFFSATYSCEISNE